MMLSRMVECMGHHVCGCVPSAKEALDVLDTVRPDIAFLDISLEGEENGISIGQVLDERLKVPFVYASAYTDDETRARAMATCPLAFISKPLGMEIVRSVFESISS